MDTEIKDENNTLPEAASQEAAQASETAPQETAQATEAAPQETAQATVAAHQETVQATGAASQKTAPEAAAPATAPTGKNKRAQPLSQEKILEIQATNDRKGIFVIIENCIGCDRVNPVGDKTYCSAFPAPSAKWRLGNCNMATHIKVEPKAGAEKVRVGQQKQKKK